MSDATVALRVTVLDMWDEIAMSVPREMTIDAVKRRALSEARVMDNADEFIVKFRGAELRQPHHSVAVAELPSDAALVVLRRGRPPVR